MFSIKLAPVVLAFVLAAASTRMLRADDQELEHIAASDAFILFDEHFRTFVADDLANLAFGVILNSSRKTTRLHIFDWRGCVEDPSTCKELVNRKFEPSLLEATQESEVKARLGDIIKLIDETIPADQQELTAVALHGLSSHDEQFMSYVGALMREDHKFAYVRVASPETLYALVRENEALRQDQEDEAKGIPLAYGVIDMSGYAVRVSHQLLRNKVTSIARRLSDASAVNAHAKSTMYTDGNSRWALHSVRFDGFGLLSAHEAYVDLLVYKFRKPSKRDKLKSKLQCFVGGKCKDDDANSVAIIDDPCAPTGYLSEVHIRPRHARKGGIKPVFLLGYKVYVDDNQFRFRRRGTGSYSKCKKLLLEVITLAKEERLNCPANSANGCSIDLVGEPFLLYESLGLIGLNEVQSTVSLLLGPEANYDHEAIVKRTQEICETPQNEANLDERLAKAWDMSSFCFKNVWVDTFLTEGLRLPANYNNLKPYVNVGNRNIHRNMNNVRAIWLDERARKSEASQPLDA